MSDNVGKIRVRDIETKGDSTVHHAHNGLAPNCILRQRRDGTNKQRKVNECKVWVNKVNKGE